MRQPGGHHQNVVPPVLLATFPQALHCQCLPPSASTTGALHCGDPSAVCPHSSCSAGLSFWRPSCAWQLASTSPPRSAPACARRSCCSSRSASCPTWGPSLGWMPTCSGTGCTARCACAHAAVCVRVWLYVVVCVRYLCVCVCVCVCARLYMCARACVPAVCTRLCVWARAYFLMCADTCLWMLTCMHFESIYNHLFPCTQMSTGRGIGCGLSPW